MPARLSRPVTVLMSELLLRTWKLMAPVAVPTQANMHPPLVSEPVVVVTPVLRVVMVEAVVVRVLTRAVTAVRPVCTRLIGWVVLVLASSIMGVTRLVRVSVVLGTELMMLRTRLGLVPVTDLRSGLACNFMLMGELASPVAAV